MSIHSTPFHNLVTKYGSPLYIYDGNRIRDNYYKFIQVFNVKNLQIYYACKALNNITILKLFQSLGAGLDCVSIYEIRLGLKAGFRPEKILFTPNNISEAEYAAAIQFGVKINVDSLNMLIYFGKKHPNIPLYIRINPHINAGGNPKIAVGHINSKFGISIDHLSEMLKIISKYKLNIIGVHVHTGSDIQDADVFLKVSNVIFDVVNEIKTIQYIDFGGGFKVPYHKADFYTNIVKFGEEFSKLFNDFSKKNQQHYTLEFEPGKFMVSNSGYFVAQVTQIKQTPNHTFVGLNTGFNHFLRPMFYNAYHEIHNVTNVSGKKKAYHIVGNICETDTFAKDRMLAEIRKDDLLVFENAGAYSATMASNYNMRPKPAEVLLWNNQDYLIRKRESFEDLLNLQVDPKMDF